MKKEMLSKVMKKAHQLAKKMTGDYIARLKMALIIAWKEVKKLMERVIDVKRFIKSNEWQNYGKHRIYVELEISGIEQKEIKGNIIGAYRKIFEKLYYDVDTNKLVYFERKGKGMSAAAKEVHEFFANEAKKMVRAELKKYGIEV